MHNKNSHYCINCDAELPDRYKGRQRIYCCNQCRKAYTARKLDEGKKDSEGKRY